jgi:hypothetical protein
MLTSSNHVSLPLTSILFVAFTWLQCDTVIMRRNNRENYTLQHHFKEDLNRVRKKNKFMH